ncbi:helix-turn-helix domain-containing protein [Sulfitobacter noctilucicola]|nr:helix-turn-helix domain-containing protein [Sulfitobacter noctilucicola]
MSAPQIIPIFTLYGETEAFPDVVHCERFSARAAALGWRISAHRHAHIAQLFLIQDGGVSATVDGAAMSLKSGQFLYIPAQMVHRFEFEPGTEGQVLSVPVGVVAAISPQSDDLRGALEKPMISETPTRLATLTELLLATVEDNGTFRTQETLALAHAILSLVAQSADDAAPLKDGKRNIRLPQFDQLIAKNLAAGWGASDYAAALSVSTGHLSRLCRDSTGLGATAYIEQARIEEACRLLAFTRLTVSEIGYRLGYDDPSYFSRRFRVVRNQAPSAYRKKFLE